MRTNKKYDLMLFIQIAVLCMGGIGGALQVSRLIAILFSPLLFRKIGKKGYGYAKRFMIIFSLFYMYFLISFIWTPDQEEAIKELFYYPVHFMLFLELIVFARNAQNPLKSISRGWLAAVLLCSVVACWEIATDNHLSMAKEQGTINAGGEIVQHMTASVTFGNYNSYVTFLCFSFPWIFYILLDNGRLLLEKPLAAIALIMALLTILINASRGGLLTIAIMLAIYYLLSKKTRWKSLVLVLAIIAVGYIIITYGEIVTAIIIARASDGGMFSDDARSAIWLDALKVFADTWGLGVGIGGMDVSMSITIAHNMFLEILVQYGVVITLIVVLFLCRLFKRSFKQEQNRKIVLIMALLTMPIYSIIDSGYLLYTHLYAHIATIYIYANYELIRHIDPILRKVA